MSRVVTFILRAAVAIFVTAFIASTASNAHATNYLVNTLNDTTGAGDCSLRDAINAAEGNPAAGSTCNTRGIGDDTIDFAPSLAGGTIALQDFLPVIDRGSLTIQGDPAKGITINGGALAYFIQVFDGFRALSLSNVKITGGNGGAVLMVTSTPAVPSATFSHCTFSGVNGPAINDSGAALSINNSTFSDNQTAVATSGAATVSASTFLNNQDGISASNRLKVTNSTLTDNLNGIILGNGAVADIEGATFKENKNAAMLLTGGIATIDNSLFDNNDAGILNEAEVRVTGSTFSNNARFGIGNDGSSSGKAKVTAINSTLSGNNAGAIFNMNGVVNADFCTFYGNAPQTIYTYKNMNFDTATLLRGNVMVGIKNCETPAPPPRFIDQGFNIASDDSCPFSGSSQNNTDPRLDPAGLKDNGGPTPTIGLQGNSPAVAFVPLLQCYTQTGSLLELTTDQRDYGRPAPAHPLFCSAGAFEYGARPRPAFGLGLPLLQLPKPPPFPRF
ncbi:MAG TPA: choice-of-anchor Q domain-containing protein [Candidatus Binataceae bacterium]|nr:choice-of-anchor Q domain-containing protein [Candidatus Binataceae bacterium]